jgi:hypothetical protein
MKCKKCNEDFKTRFYLNGKRYDYRGRVCCYYCVPIRMMKYNKSLILFLYNDELSYKKYRVNYEKSTYNKIQTTKYTSCKILKLCSKCRKEKRIKIKENKCNQCKKLDKQNIKQWALKISAVKYKGEKCKECGWSTNNIKDYICFDFHHRNPEEKEFLLSRIKTRSLDDIKKELDKCDLLCAMCHRKKHLYNYTAEQINKILEQSKDIIDVFNKSIPCI